MDEMGHQGGQPLIRRSALSPLEVTTTNSSPVPRTGKRVTLIGCVSADRSFLKAAVVISRTTCDEDIELLGLTSEKVIIYHQSKGYIDRAIFEDWLQSIFLSEVVAQRHRHSYHGPAFLIVDNCSAHASDDIDELCRDNNVA
jgi:hypothetical protein